MAIGQARGLDVDEHFRLTLPPNQCLNRLHDECNLSLHLLPVVEDVKVIACKDCALDVNLGFGCKRRSGPHRPRVDGPMRTLNIDIFPLWRAMSGPFPAHFIHSEPKRGGRGY
jgi:hypothetical protein